MIGHRTRYLSTDIIDFSTAARALISSVATGLSYSSANGQISITSGYGIPTTTEISNWDTAYGWGNHAGLYDAAGTASSAISGHQSSYNHALLHAAASLDANADSLLSIAGQQLGLDTQTANFFFIGPDTGSPAVPTFRAMVAADLCLVTVIKGGTGLTTVAAGSVLAANTSNTVIAVTSTSALKILKNSDGTISWVATTGTGSAVLSNSPTLVTPTLGVATATTINKVTITQPANSATVTIADGKTLTLNNSITFAGTDGTTMTFPATSGNVYVSGATDVAVADGGTGKSAWNQWGLVYADTTASLAQLGAGTAGQIVRSGGSGAAPAWSLATYPYTTTAGQILFSTSNDVVGQSSYLTYSGNVLYVLGFVNATQGFRVNGAATAGTMLRGDGSAFGPSTATWPNTVGAGSILYATGTNTVGSTTNFSFGSGGLAVNSTVNVGSSISVSNAAGGGSPFLWLVSQNAAGYYPPVVYFYRSGISDAATPNDSAIGAFWFNGRDSTGNYVGCGGCQLSIGTNASGGAPSFLDFYTSPSGGPSTNRLRIDSTGAVLPMGTAGNQNLGNSSYYWGDISYKTLTDRGCLGWFDEGVELLDGRKVSDVEALCAIEKHPTKETIYGVPSLDYATMPKAVFRKAAIDGRELPRDEHGEPYLADKAGQRRPAADGAEISALVSIMLGAIRQLSTEAAGLRAEVASLRETVAKLTKQAEVEPEKSERSDGR